MKIARFLNSRLFELITLVMFRTLAYFAVSLFILLIGTMIFKGIDTVHFSFLYKASTGAGYSGGVRYQILGTLILVLSGSLITVPFSVPYALLYCRYSKNEKLRGGFLLILHLLNSTPSIIFGVLGYLLFYKAFGWQKSWLSGGFVLATMMLPTVTNSLIERIKTIPREYMDGAKAMGFNEDHLVTAVLLPYAWGGLLTGLVLGVARAAGETAPILFTAAVFSGATIPNGVVDNPVLALPYHIFNLAQDVHGHGGMQAAWATAVVLTLLTATLSLVASPFRARSHEEAKA